MSEKPSGDKGSSARQAALTIDSDYQLTKHVTSSIAGAGSGDFNVYRAKRRAEQLRLEKMERDQAVETQLEAEEKHREELKQRQRQLEDRAHKHNERSKRRKLALRAREKHPPSRAADEKQDD